MPVVLGSNRDEMSFWLLTALSPTLTEAAFEDKLRDFRPAVFGNASLLAEVKALYDDTGGSSTPYPYPKDLGNLSAWWWRAMRVATDSVLAWSV